MGVGDLHASGKQDERRGEICSRMKADTVSTMVGRLRGLLGREGYEGEILLVKCNDIHTFGMRLPIDVAFVDDRGVVIAVYRSVQPGCRLRCPDARAVLERFAAPGAWHQNGDCPLVGKAVRNDVRGAAL